MSLQLIFILILCGVMTNIMSAIFWHRWRRIDGTYSLHLIPTVPFTNDCCNIIDDCYGIVLY